ncbi:radical SAM domain-containing protein [Actinoplanes sp. N902-109]|nr:radical SAM domain-containing protein [Actinoplanes sp. N902-109]
MTMILPALTEATSPLFRPVKYSLFPPLGLATLAGYLRDDDEVRILDEHVERIDDFIDGDEPDVVVIQVYITSARRSYEIAAKYRERGVFVALGGLHVTSLPEEAAQHADAIFLGPGEDTWPHFLDDFRRGEPRSRYVSSERTLHHLPPIRRDLIRRERYLVPNSIVVTRGCPHHCDFCYKDAFFAGGKSFYTQQVDAALAEIERLPGKHLYFLDDHLFGNRRFAEALFEGMRGMGRVFQAAGTVDAILGPGTAPEEAAGTILKLSTAPGAPAQAGRRKADLLARAAAAGLRSMFVGLETINAANLTEQRKRQNVGRSYEAVVRKLHDAGVMINASFVFGMDGDGPDVFDRTVEWGVANGLETATFHIMTPYPGTALHRRMAAAGRIVHQDWDRYDTRHVVHRPQGMTAGQLEDGYWRAYRDFYRWRAIWDGAKGKPAGDRMRHLAYAGGWKKFEPMWDTLIRSRQVLRAMPVLERVLNIDRYGYS